MSTVVSAVSDTAPWHAGAFGRVPAARGVRLSALAFDDASGCALWNDRHEVDTVIA